MSLKIQDYLLWASDVFRPDYERELLAQAIQCKDTNPSRILQDNIYTGIEVELEGVTNPSGVFGFQLKEDNSLRNHGTEYVTLGGLRGPCLSLAVSTLFSSLPASTHFSPRTSIHVHVNVRDLTFDQLFNVAMLYYVFEAAFFHYVGRNRDRSVFCVPWGSSFGYSNFIQSIQSNRIVKNTFFKYHALNIVPVTNPRQGTIEFRHMYGTRDLTKIFDWINIIHRLIVMAKEIEKPKLIDIVLALNTNSEYGVFRERVFGPELAEKLTYIHSARDMGIGVKQVKRDLYSIKREKAFSPESPATVFIKKHKAELIKTGPSFEFPVEAPTREAQIRRVDPAINDILNQLHNLQRPPIVRPVVRGMFDAEPATTEARRVTAVEDLALPEWDMTDNDEIGEEI